MQSRYTNKGTLPNVLLDEMRSAYARAAPMPALAGANSETVVPSETEAGPEPTQPSEQDHIKQVDYPNQPDQLPEMAIRVVTDPASAMKLLVMSWRIVGALEQGKIALEPDSNSQKMDSNSQNRNSHPRRPDSHPQGHNSGGLAPSEDAGLEGLAPLPKSVRSLRTMSIHHRKQRNLFRHLRDLMEQTRRTRMQTVHQVATPGIPPCSAMSCMVRLAQQRLKEIHAVLCAAAPHNVRESRRDGCQNIRHTAQHNRHQPHAGRQPLDYIVDILSKPQGGPAELPSCTPIVKTFI